jgi:hypothetical protein
MLVGRFGLYKCICGGFDILIFPMENILLLTKIEMVLHMSFIGQLETDYPWMF